MKYKLLCLILVALCHKSYAQDSSPGGCIFDDGVIDPSIPGIVNEPIKDTNDPPLNKAYAYKSNLKLNNFRSDGDYLNVINDEDNKQLIFTTTDSFKNLDLNTKFQTAEVKITVTLEVTCDSDAVLYFWQNVIDTNNNPPVFSADSYVIETPMPIPPKYDLTFLSTNPIVITDIDYTNKDVSLTIDSDKFIVSVTKDSSDPMGKSYVASIRVIDFVWLNDASTTFTLTATDAGTPPQSSSVSLTINTDKEHVIDPEDVEVKFEKNSYHLICTVDDSNGQTTCTPDSEIKLSVKVDGDVRLAFDNEYFEASYDSNTEIVTISTTNKPLENMDNKILVATLTASVSNIQTDTTIVFQLPPDVVIGIPKFSSSYYTATYTKNPGDNDDTIKIDNEGIISVNEESATVQLVPNDYSERFNINQDDTGNWQLTLIEDLDDSVLNAGIDIEIELKAVLNDSPDSEPGFSVVIVRLPKPEQIEAPKFDKNFYTAIYKGNGDDTDTISLDGGLISLTPTDAELDVKVTGTYENYFQTDKTDTGYDLKVITPLDSDIIKNNFEITVSIEATLKDASTFTVVVVSLPKTIIKPIIFSSVLYEASYEISGDTANVVLKDATSITLEGGENNNINVNEPYNTNFNVVYNSDTETYDITIMAPLSEDILNENSIIFISLEAFADVDSIEHAFATIALQLPTPTIIIPTFTQTYYTAEYTTNGDTGSVSMKGDSIEISNSNPDKTNVELKGTYASNFKLTPDADKKIYTLTVDAPLENDLSDAEIILELVATYEDATGHATLVINLPAKQTITFGSAFYTAKYIVNSGANNDDEIKSDSDIIINGEYSQVNPTGEYGANFDVNCEAEKCTLSVKTDLEDSVLSEKTEIVLTLEAFKEENNKATTIVIVSLPLQDETLTPKFTSTGYIAKYTANPGENDDEVNVENGPIKIEGDDVGVLSIIDTSNNFELQIINNEWKVKVIKDLSAEQLKENSLVFELQAKFTGGINIGSSALVIRLPGSEPSQTLSFSNSVYTADYVKGSDGNPPTIEHLNQNILIKNPNADIKVSLETDYLALLNEPQFDSASGIVTITFKESLPDEALLNSVVIITVNAVDSTGTTSAELVLKLPKEVVASEVFFEKSVYEGEYIEASPPGLANIQIAGDITFIAAGSDYNSVTVDKGDGDYWDYFTLTLNYNKVVIAVQKNLEDEILSENNVITLNFIATKDTTRSEAALIVKLPIKNNVPVIQFDSPVYNTKYIKGSTGQQSSIEETLITIEGSYQDIKDTDITLKGDYATNFGFTFSVDNGKINLTLGQDLPDSVLNGADSFVTVTIVVKEGTSDEIQTTVIIELPKSVVPSTIQFTQSVYLSTYVRDNATSGHIEYENNVEIEIQSTSGCNGLTFTLLGDNKDLFERVSEACRLKVTLKDSALPDSVLNGDSSIVSVDIQAKNADSDVTAALVVKLPRKFVSTSIYFEKSVYQASYSAEGSDHITLVDSIKVAADDAAKLQQITVDKMGENSKYCDIKYDDTTGIVSISMPNVLPPDILNQENSIISFDIEATLDKETSVATIVIELPKQIRSKVIYFLDSVYLANYTADNDDVYNITDVDIALGAEDPSKLTDITVSLDSESSNYFTADYDKNGHVKIIMNTPLPDSIISEDSVYPITITAKREDVSDSSTLVIQLPKKIAPATFDFQSSSFTAKYYEEGGNYKIAVEGTIGIEGENLSNIKLTLEGEYAKYFDVEYSAVNRAATATVTINIKENLPAEVLNNNDLITLSLVAERGGIEKMNSALIIKLPRASEGGGDSDNNDDETAFIAVIAVLAVLLVAALVGSAFFYYKKLRHRVVSNVFDEKPPERFTKNLSTTDSRKFDHPTRRPTTGIQFPLNGSTGNMESNTEEPPFIEPRKSVAFDEKVDELHIESSGELDDENDENERDANNNEDKIHDGRNETITDL